MAKVQTIRLCEGHKGGFGLLRAMAPRATYRGVLIAKLRVIVVGRGDSCVQCKANRVAREKVRK